jgi:hypothetical protein
MDIGVMTEGAKGANGIKKSKKKGVRVDDRKDTILLEFQCDSSTSIINITKQSVQMRTN